MNKLRIKARLEVLVLAAAVGHPADGYEVRAV